MAFRLPPGSSTFLAVGDYDTKLNCTELIRKRRELIVLFSWVGNSYISSRTILWKTTILMNWIGLSVYFPEIQISWQQDAEKKGAHCVLSLNLMAIHSTITVLKGYSPVGKHVDRLRILWNDFCSSCGLDWGSPQVKGLRIRNSWFPIPRNKD